MTLAIAMKKSGKDYAGERTNAFYLSDQLVATVVYGGINVRFNEKERHLANSSFLGISKDQFDRTVLLESLSFAEGYFKKNLGKEDSGSFGALIFKDVKLGKYNAKVAEAGGICEGLIFVVDLGVDEFSAEYDGRKIRYAVFKIPADNFAEDKVAMYAIQNGLRLDTLTKDNPYDSSIHVGKINKPVTEGICFLAEFWTDCEIERLCRIYENSDCASFGDGVDVFSPLSFQVFAEFDPKNDNMLRILSNGLFVPCWDSLQHYVFGGSPFIKIEGRVLAPDSFQYYDILEDANANPYRYAKTLILSQIFHSLLESESENNKDKFLELSMSFPEKIDELSAEVDSDIDQEIEEIKDPELVALLKQGKSIAASELNYAKRAFTTGFPTYNDYRTLVEARISKAKEEHPGHEEIIDRVWTAITGAFSKTFRGDKQQKDSRDPLDYNAVYSLLDESSYAADPALIEMNARAILPLNKKYQTSIDLYTSLMQYKNHEISQSHKVVISSFGVGVTRNGQISLSVDPRKMQMVLDGLTWVDSFRDIMYIMSSSGVALSSKGVYAGIQLLLGSTNYRKSIATYAPAETGDWYEANRMDMLFGGDIAFSKKLINGRSYIDDVYWTQRSVEERRYGIPRLQTRMVNNKLHTFVYDFANNAVLDKCIDEDLNTISMETKLITVDVEQSEFFDCYTNGELEGSLYLPNQSFFDLVCCTKAGKQ